MRPGIDKVLEKAAPDPAPRMDWENMAQQLDDLQPLTMDDSAITSMKSVAKCEN